MEQTKEIIKLFNIENGKELTNLYCKSVVFLLGDVFEKIVEVSFKEFVIKPLY